jgi:hypothetical protein
MEQQQKFYKTALEKEILISKLQKNPSLYNLFKKRKYLTDEINKDIKTRTKGQINSFCVILLSGMQGTFKSSLAQEIATDNDPTFNIERISFLYNDFRDKLEKSKKGEWYILDEEVFLSGIGSMRILESLMTCIETLRQHGANLIIISPNPKYFPEHIFTHHIETIDKNISGTCKLNKNSHEIRTCPSEQHEEIQATIRSAIVKDREYLGFYVTKITRWNSPLWQQYQKIKKEFMTKVLKEDFQKIDYKKIATDIVMNPKSVPYKSSKQLMLFLEQNCPNLSISEKNLLVEEIKMIRRIYQQEKLNEAIQ